VNPRIELLREKKLVLVGMRLAMSFANYNVGELWKVFMPRPNEIINNLTGDLISMVIYKPTYFSTSNRRMNLKGG
jgi:AraC family transcriptional regulator